VAGEAALKLDAGDPRPWFAAMKLAFENPLWRARQRERSLERARNFSWSLTARRTREVYVEARRRFEA
jgi:glycosyltransferase involved in cell wall biosynthesis